MLLKSSEDSLCDRFEESNCNEVEFERASTPDTCKRISLSHTASAAFRTGVSERDVALIASAMLQEARLVMEDKNLVLEEKDKRHRRLKDEHIALLSKPGSQYLGHLTPRSGHGEEIAASLFLFLVRTKLI
ncbi:hypothetical protein AVEN_161332-1 [Araneus ventricosus]|uniref:Uncharacterized protein n=1 Tax=Araneus ventricosus TaxID=182803 RepID=A0A4Y2WPB6_ARAVE|nr:hypothetical protein AVEN_161332-1 [Araneus ventricosus]